MLRLHQNMGFAQGYMLENHWRTRGTSNLPITGQIFRKR